MNINYYNPYVRQELELYHHGIAGMKWGKRNGPPYPLAASAHSASEKKAGWRKSLNGGSGKSGNKSLSTNHVKKLKSQYAALKTNSEKSKQARDDIDKFYSKRITKEDESALDSLQKQVDKNYNALKDLDDKNLVRLGKKRKIDENDSVFNKSIKDIKDRKLKNAYKDYINAEDELDNKKVELSNKIVSDHIKEIPEAKNVAYRSIERHMIAKQRTDLNNELKFLSKTADKKPEDTTDDDVNRYMAFQKKIIDKSIDWYNDEPKSSSAKKWKKERDQEIKRVNDTLYKKWDVLDKIRADKYEKLLKEYEGKPLEEDWDTFYKKSNSINYDSKLKKARDDYRNAEQMVFAKYNDKLIEIVLKDLGLPVTDENKYFIDHSGVLFWD